jgi:hypothetical protein
VDIVGKAKKARKKIKRRLREERAKLHPPEHGMAPDQRKGKRKDKGDDEQDDTTEQAEEHAQATVDALDGNRPTRKTPKVRSGIKKDVITAIHVEMNAMCAGATWAQTPLNGHMLDGQKFVLLEQASGKVAEALTYDRPDSTRVYDELIRTAVMAASWAQSLGPDKGRGRKSQWAPLS